MAGDWTEALMPSSDALRVGSVPDLFATKGKSQLPVPIPEQLQTRQCSRSRSGDERNHEFEFFSRCSSPRGFHIRNFRSNWAFSRRQSRLLGETYGTGNSA